MSNHPLFAYLCRQSFRFFDLCYDHTPFGQSRNATGQASTNRYTFSGKETQTTGNLGYFDFGARFYDSRIGRWHSIDPLTEKYYSVNPYAYCANNPILYWDPDGQDFKKGMRYLWESVSGRVSFGAQVAGEIEVSGKKIGGVVNLASGDIYKIKHGESQKGQGNMVRQEFAIGIGAASIGVDKEVVRKDEKDATITSTVTGSLGPVVVSNTETTEVKVNGNVATPGKPKHSTEMKGKVYSTSIALLLGIDVEIDFEKFVKALDELFNK